MQEPEETKKFYFGNKALTHNSTLNENSSKLGASSFLAILRKLIPDVSVDLKLYNELYHETTEEVTKVILSNYFEKKKSNGAISELEVITIEKEAKYIQRLIPSLSIDYITDQLKLFADMSNRKEIVLRIIINAKMLPTNKRPLPEKAENQVALPAKVRKIQNESTDTKLPQLDTFLDAFFKQIDKESSVMNNLQNKSYNEPTSSISTIFDNCNEITNNEEMPTTSFNDIKLFNEAVPSTSSTQASAIKHPKTENELPLYQNVFEAISSTSTYHIPIQNEVKISVKDFDVDVPPISLNHTAVVTKLPETTINDISSVQGAIQEVEVQMETPIASTSIIEITDDPIIIVDPISSIQLHKNVDQRLVNYICSIFPDACPHFIKKSCRNYEMNDENVDRLTTYILNLDGKYPQRRVPKIVEEPTVTPEAQFVILQEVLPDADPDYLRMICDRYDGKPNEMKSFINEAMENKSYPTLKDYQRRQQLSAQQKQYTTEFNVKNFIKVIPDPKAFFSDPSRVIQMDHFSGHYADTFLRNTFNKVQLKTIQTYLHHNRNNVYKTYRDLKNLCENNHQLMKSMRKKVEMPNTTNIPLLQEIAFCLHETEIETYLNEMKLLEIEELKKARADGTLNTCQCCYDEEILPRITFKCNNGCAFCQVCIVKSTEVRFSEGKLDFPCLSSCSGQFSLQTLQSVLSPKLFSRIAQKKTLEEVKAAGIEELEMCPFCDFATIPAAGYTIFSCLNPECMKESCRNCKQLSHIPYRCDEIEQDAEVRARTFIENKMTEALLRKCWKCGIKFFKEEGCNKMTCSCGAHMCYICGQPVKDYKHFNGNGGDRFDLCPLYSDTNTLNKENVLKGAEEAKAEVGNQQLKYDPTKDVEQYYARRQAVLPKNPPVINPVEHAQIFARFRQMERNGRFQVHIQGADRAGNHQHPQRTRRHQRAQEQRPPHN